MSEVWLFSPQKFGLVWFVLRIGFVLFGRVNKNWFDLVWLD